MLPHHVATWFRHGDTTDAADFYRAFAAAPTLISHGIAVPPDRRDELATVDITSIAAGAHSFTLILHGYKPAVGIYIADVLTPIVDATRGPGWTNIGEIAIAATGASQHTAHQLQGVSGFTRLAAEVSGAVGAPGVWADFGFSPHQED